MDLKIDRQNISQKNITTRGTTECNKVVGENSTTFDSHLQKQGSLNLNESLKKMADDIIKQGERLSQRVDIAELKAYKRMVSEFLNEAVRGFAKFSKENHMDRRGRHRIYTTVKKVNAKLEELTEEILKQEKDNLKIIGRIEDIRGLILDIIL
ncbi:MAG: YaaR family protein [Clostridiaceae bacterium]|jgi:uncharacterized protein YaaR (DUF327 family)|nr:YaaR family protein [Clostridiaceae bacterium]